MRHCYHSLLMSPFPALWCPGALLSLSASHILFLSNNFHTIAVRVNVLGKYVSRWVVNDEHEWIFLPAQQLFRFGSNTSVNREPLLSSKDFYSSNGIFLEKKPLVSSQITAHRQLLFLPPYVAGLEGTHIHCESTCVCPQDPECCNRQGQWHLVWASVPVSLCWIDSPEAPFSICLKVDILTLAIFCGAVVTFLALTYF